MQAQRSLPGHDTLNENARNIYCYNRTVTIALLQSQENIFRTRTIDKGLVLKRAEEAAAQLIDFVSRFDTPTKSRASEIQILLFFSVLRFHSHRGQSMAFFLMRRREVTDSIKAKSCRQCELVSLYLLVEVEEHTTGGNRSMLIQSD